MNKLKHFLAIVYMGLLLSSCGGPIYEQYKAVDDNTWPKNEPYSFTVNVPEAGRYALFINLRYNEDYNYSNLWVKTDLQPPKGDKISQRFNIPLFSPDGAPLQDALGSVYFRKFPAQRIEQKLLPFDATEAGTYTFTLSQEMRADELPGIEKIGLQVKRME